MKKYHEHANHYELIPDSGCARRSVKLQLSGAEEWAPLLGTWRLGDGMQKQMHCVLFSGLCIDKTDPRKGCRRQWRECGGRRCYGHSHCRCDTVAAAIGVRPHLSSGHTYMQTWAVMSQIFGAGSEHKPLAARMQPFNQVTHATLKPSHASIARKQHGACSACSFTPWHWYPMRFMRCVGVLMQPIDLDIIHFNHGVNVPV
jgi:hypothetical protein